MRLYNIEQYSPKWYELRRGIPTASSFDKIVTPTGKLSASSREYCNKLLVEYFFGRDEDSASPRTYWMERGHELEAEARRLYAFGRAVEVQEVGFITNDAGTIGASPDFLVGDAGLGEIKCPAPWTHVDNMLNNQIDKSYYPQIQGQLYVAEREWSDWMSYHPAMPEVLVRTYRDDAFIKTLAEALDQFVDQLQERKHKLIALGVQSIFETEARS